jgi:hypothetical protein
MERPSTSLRASKLLPLMVFAQAQLSSAYPFAPKINAETGDLEAGPQPHFAPNHVVPRPGEGLDTTSWPTTSCTDETAAHWTGPPVVQIADGQIQAPVAKFSKIMESKDGKDSSAWSSQVNGILTATEWQTSTATVFDWTESTQQPAGAPSGEVLTSTLWSVASTATVTNWDTAASSGSVAAAITTSQSTLPSFEVVQKGVTSATSNTSVTSNTSELMALEATIKKTYSRSSDSTTTDPRCGI